MRKLTDEIEDKIKQVEDASSSLSSDCEALETLLGQAESEGANKKWLSGIRARLATAKRKLNTTKKNLDLQAQLEARRIRESETSNGNPPKPRTPKG